MSWRTGIAVLSFLALVGIIQYPRVADFVRDLTTSPATVTRPDPSIAAPGEATARSGSGQNVPRQVNDSKLTVDDLKLLALDYINEDRKLYGLEPVVLGNNSAAQDHADDMVEGRYLGHWWLDGRKPYMVYSQTGGTSYVSENAARTGFSEAEFTELCMIENVSCEKVDPPTDIRRLHHAMVYDDASSEWRHRDNVLDPRHRKVNIGIAYTDHFLSLVQHFEGGDVTSPLPPTVDGTLIRIRADLNEPGVSIFPTVQVYYEAPPVPHTVDEIEQFTTYCVGGGFSEECGEPVVQIVPPPQPGTRYLNLPDNIIVARSWVVSGGDLEIVADLGEFLSEPGVYTTSLYEDPGTGYSGDLLLQLSTVKS